MGSREDVVEERINRFVGKCVIAEMKVVMGAGDVLIDEIVGETLELKVKCNLGWERWVVVVVVEVEHCSY